MAGPVTWKSDIQPMLNAWGEIPDMIEIGYDLNNYQFVASNYKVLRDRMADGSMPPGVSDDRIAFIETWIDNNAPAADFPKIQNILDRAVGGKTSIGAHGAFWRDQDRDQFVAYKVFGSVDLIVPNNGAESNLVKALKGESPFDGSRYRRMPAGFWWTEDQRATNVAKFEQWKADGFVEYIPTPPFSEQITPVLADSAQDWAGKLLSIPAWADDPPVGTFEASKRAMKSVVNVGMQAVVCGSGTSPTDVVSLVAISGPGASLVDVAVYTDGTGADVKYQGWNGSGWSDGPAISSDGVYWYRAEVKPSATVFYAATYHQSGGTGEAFDLWAFQSKEVSMNTGFNDVVAILDKAVGGPTAPVGAHGPFWRNTTRDDFVAKSVFGQKLIELNNGAESNLIKVLKGMLSGFRQMPAGRDPVPDSEITTIQDWIDAGAPA